MIFANTTLIGLKSDNDGSRVRRNNITVKNEDILSTVSNNLNNVVYATGDHGINVKVGYDSIAKYVKISIGRDGNTPGIILQPFDDNAGSNARGVYGFFIPATSNSLLGESSDYVESCYIGVSNHNNQSVIFFGEKPLSYSMACIISYTDDKNSTRASYNGIICYAQNLRIFTIDDDGGTSTSESFLDVGSGSSLGIINGINIDSDNPNNIWFVGDATNYSVASTIARTIVTDVMASGQSPIWYPGILQIIQSKSALGNATNGLYINGRIYTIYPPNIIIEGE